MREGVLKFFNVKKGFGFINDNETGKRYFVRFCSFSQKLARIPVVNSKVFFDVAEETEPLPEGCLPLAVNVTFKEEIYYLSSVNVTFKEERL